VSPFFVVRQLARDDWNSKRNYGFATGGKLALSFKIIEQKFDPVRLTNQLIRSEGEL